MLNKSEKTFCEQYVANGYHATSAYLAAYPNCSYNSAKQGACRKLKKQEVLDYIAELQKEAFKANCISAERIALELANMAFEQDANVVSHPNKLKALDLLQKQMGLQQKKVDASIDAPSIKITIGPDDVEDRD